MYQEIGSKINAESDGLADTMVAFIYARYPDIAQRMGPGSRQKSRQDLKYHLVYLAQAMMAEDTILFSEYIGWARVLFAGLKVPASCLTMSLEAMESVLAEHLSSEDMSVVKLYLDAGRHQSLEVTDMTPSHISAGAPLSDLARQYVDSLLRGERQVASQVILDAVESGVSVRDIYLHVFQPAQYEVGRLWQTNQISVAQEHFCTAATQLVMSQLYPHIFNNQKTGQKLVATCVGGDLHEIGVRMVADFFEMEGWDTYYLGANTPAESVVRTIKEREPDILGISATMTFHVDAVAALIAAVRAEVGGKMPKILVGGYPFNVQPQLWRRVGADGYGADAQRALSLAANLVKGE